MRSTVILKNDFNAEYSEYRGLHARIERVTRRFTQLDAQLRQLSQGSEEYEVVPCLAPVSSDASPPVLGGGAALPSSPLRVSRACLGSSAASAMRLGKTNAVGGR